jgi:glutamate racemase
MAVYQMKIGVFDSGIGGLSVANAVKHAFPQHEIIFKNDAEHVPYGTKTTDEVLAFSLPVLQSLVEDGVNCIVIACNTVSTNLIELLRQLISVPLIPMEPMVERAAAQTKTGVIAVCATPATLASLRYAQLKSEFAADITVLEPDCSNWATMIEDDAVDQQQIAHHMQQVIGAQADVIVLGCTHYHWIEEEIYQVVNGYATVLQPEPFVVEEIKRVLARLA